MKKLRTAALLLSPALLLLFAQAGGAAPTQRNVKKTSTPIWKLAIDGPRVAYASGNRIHVWNIATGATSVVAGKYDNVRFTSQLAIAGKRVAWIKDQQFGNTEEGEKLYTASISGKAKMIHSVYRHGVDDPTLTNGGWIEGLVGSGNGIAVSTWRSNGTTATDEQLSLVTSRGLSPLAGGPGAIVASSKDGGHIADLLTSPWSDSRSVSIYSTAGDMLQQVALDPPDANTTGTEIAISGNLLVVLTTRLFEPSGPTTVTLQVYDWTTGDLLNTWPVGINHYGGEVSFSVVGKLAAVQGPSRLHLVDLDTGKDVTLVRSGRPGWPPALDSRGLVYATGSAVKGSNKLTFVPMAKLLAMVSG
ncbi:MAG TPA: hypothetical protein VJ716_00860 [Gaiellaceae bacterium]|nr:hypothetical protein [Gaiellaceae bacterium]